jgi:hypothetical protein
MYIVHDPRRLNEDVITLPWLSFLPPDARYGGFRVMYSYWLELNFHGIYNS